MSPSSDPEFTIVIPVVAINSHVREAVEHILLLDVGDWELIVVTNEESPSEWSDARIQVVASGRVGPGAKRDLAAQMARGNILVFLDDDSYPRADLLEVARPYFADPAVIALGGPALTPSDDAFWQRVSGTVFLSRFTGGHPDRYVPVGTVREVRDWPSVNFMVRKSRFLAVGGFNTPYWPGEDTKLCLDLIRTGQKILYVPDLIVWHHRRPGLGSHLKQVGAYGLHRGFFAKRFPETSFKFAYFAPSLFVVFCMFSVFYATLSGPAVLGLLVLLGWALYALALLAAFLNFRSHAGFLVACCSVPWVVGTHLVYGLQFIRGFLLKKSLGSQLR